MSVAQCDSNSDSAPRLSLSTVLACVHILNQRTHGIIVQGPFEGRHNAAAV